MDVQRGTRSAVALAHDAPNHVQGLCQSRRKSEFQSGRRRLAIPGLREVDDKKAIDNDRVYFSVCGVWQAVATFDFRQETLRHEEALLFNRCWKHHIVPQW